MTENDKKNTDMISKMNTFLKATAATATIALVGWLAYTQTASAIDEMKGNTSWKKYHEGQTQGWNEYQYVEAILSAPGIKSNANIHAILAVQKEVNEYRFQTEQEPIKEDGRFGIETVKALTHSPIEVLQKILDKPELAVSNGYQYQKQLWDERKKAR